MGRAAILIGVNKTGGLPQLSDAVNGARDMATWALEQGMDKKNVHLFTDDTGPVEAHTIRAAIKSLVDAGTIEQLFIYFAGHGVNIRYGEYWLLSGAPEDSSAAINVDGCVYRARASGIPHVIFISDACRSAAQGVQGQGIDGSVVFPNDPVAGPEQAVDMFFATTLGRPALEVRDAVGANAPYKALYTRAFLDAVYGRLPGCMAVEGAVKVVRPRLLKTCLSAVLPQRMATLAMTATISQIPDARVTSGDDAWLAKFAVELAPKTVPPGSIESIPRGGAIGPSRRFDVRFPTGPFSRNYTPQEKAAQQIGELLRNAAEASTVPQSRGQGTWKYSGAVGSEGFQLPWRYAVNESGIAVVGAVIDRCFVNGGKVDTGLNPSWVAVAVDGPAVDALITFGDGSAALLPVIKGFVTSLRIDDGELADVAFQPAIASRPVNGCEFPYLETSQLRVAVANAARGGIFRLDGENGRLLAAHMRQPGLIDPSLALYAAYGFHDQQMHADLLHLNRVLKEQLSIAFFDIGLLCKNPAPGTSALRQYTPVAPLLARGWSIWASDRSQIPEALKGLQHELLPSLWSHFTAAGAERLHAFLSTRRI